MEMWFWKPSHVLVAQLDCFLCSSSEEKKKKKKQQKYDPVTIFAAEAG